MTQEKVNEIFKTDIGIQLEVIYVTSDDKVFVRYKEALLHTNDMLNGDPENFVDTKITEWYNENYKTIIPKTTQQIINDNFSGGLDMGQIIPKEDLEKEMFELEQQLDIPSSLRWHNSKPKKETLEEAKESYLDSPLPHSYKRAVEFGVKWQQEQDKNKYSEEIVNILDNVRYWETCPNSYKVIIENFIEQFKNK